MFFLFKQLPTFLTEVTISRMTVVFACYSDSFVVCCRNVAHSWFGYYGDKSRRRFLKCRFASGLVVVAHFEKMQCDQ